MPEREDPPAGNDARGHALEAMRDPLIGYFRRRESLRLQRVLRNVPQRYRHADAGPESDGQRSRGRHRSHERVSTTNATLDEEPRSADWCDAQRLPTAHFVSNRVVKTGPRSARIEGSFTMHGVTRPLILDADFGGASVDPLSKAYTIGLQATGQLRRSDFGVTKYVPLVCDDVTLAIAAAFEKTN